MVGFEQEEDDEEEEIYNQDKQATATTPLQQPPDIPMELDKRAKMERVL